MGDNTTVSMKSLLDENALFRDKLYCRGFLITNAEIIVDEGYPFYNNWYTSKISNYNFILHKETSLYFNENNGEVLFLIGHAYNPYDMDCDEKSILNKLHQLQGKEFWNYESTITGVYVMGKITPDGRLLHWTDCAGMRISYYGRINDKYYVTSHANIVAELCCLSENKYITKLKNNRYFQLFGNVLPGDFSAYSELKRVVPNHCYSSGGEVFRFFPIEPIKECNTENEYQSVLDEASGILRNTLSLCAKKWKGKNVAISVTGGKDSGETFASANGLYNEFQFFSYISKPEEAVDAYAAAEMCKTLNVNHRVINVPDYVLNENEFELINRIIYHNSGNVGFIKPNEVRKRELLINEKSIDVEVKSWVNEIVRAYWYKKYRKQQFPAKPSGRYLATLYKVFVENRILFLQTAKVFDEYIKKYISEEDIELFGDWTTLWSWEFGFSAGEGLSLFSEHMLSFDITIPFNNRRLLYTMLRPNKQDRINDRLQRDIIKVNNPEQAALNVDIVNVAHNSKRALLEKIYLLVNSHLPF